MTPDIIEKTFTTILYKALSTIINTFINIA